MQLSAMLLSSFLLTALRSESEQDASRLQIMQASGMTPVVQIAHAAFTKDLACLSLAR